MSEGAEGAFTFKDSRRIDPLTGEARDQATAPAPTPPGDDKVAELTNDLQRLQAEFSNYRKRVTRDQDLTRQLAVASTLADLIPVLDDIQRARAHGDLEGAFKSVGESFEGTVERLGLHRFGEPGETFDPTVHEAIGVQESADVSEATVGAVHQVGYQFADRVVRPAVVTVVEPVSAAAAAEDVAVDNPTT